MRLVLVLFSKEKPDLIDARLTNFFFFREEEDLKKYGPKVSHIPLFDFFDYKYLVSIDGTVAAYRLASLLSGSSLVIKQKSKYYEHFYHRLQPGKHYIEAKGDISDIHAILSRLTNQSDPNYMSVEAQKSIVKEANQFVKNHLLAPNIYCYYYRAITQYSLILNHESRMISLEAEDDHVVNPEHPCDCHHEKSRSGSKGKTQTIKEEL